MIITYFVFRCDNSKNCKTIVSDMFFELSEFDLVIEYKQKLDNLNCYYDFVIETFDSKTDTILLSNYIVRLNYIN